MVDNFKKIFFDHNAFTIYLIEKNVVEVYHKKGEMELASFIKMKDEMLEYSKINGNIYVINTQHRGFNFSTETWKYIRNNAKSFTFINAQALVAEELHFRILAKFHAKVTKSKTKFKVVKSFDEALIWIKAKKLQIN